jgi:hypothetical protein
VGAWGEQRIPFDSPELQRLLKQKAQQSDNPEEPELNQLF